MITRNNYDKSKEIAAPAAEKLLLEYDGERWLTESDAGTVEIDAAFVPWLDEEPEKPQAVEPGGYYSVGGVLTYCAAEGECAESCDACAVVRACGHGKHPVIDCGSKKFGQGAPRYLRLATVEDVERLREASATLNGVVEENGEIVVDDAPQEAAPETTEAAELAELRQALAQRKRWEERVAEVTRLKQEARDLEAEAKETARKAKKDAEKYEAEHDELVAMGAERYAEFLAMQTPLLDIAENWRELPVGKLRDALGDATFAVVEENFRTLGQISDWLGSDPRSKIKGLTEKRVDAISDALETFYAEEERAEFVRADVIAAEREAARRDAEADETPLDDYETDAAREAIDAINDMLEYDVWEGFDADWFLDVSTQFEDDEKSLTRAQFQGICNIYNEFQRRKNAEFEDAAK